MQKPTKIDILISIAIYFIIGFAWRGLEILLYGQPEPKIADDIIAGIMFVFILNNIALANKFKNTKIETGNN